MPNKLFFSILFIFVLNGCSWFKSSQVTEISTPRFDVTAGIRTIDPQVLSHGGNLLFIPFSPGPQIAATNKLDQMALTMIRGVYDVFNDDPDNLWLVVDADKKTQIDFILSGRITKVNSNRGLLSFYKSNSITVEFTGKIINATNSKEVALIENLKLKSMGKESFSELGYAAGKEIGEYLMKFNKNNKN